MATRIQLRRGTSDHWLNANPILAEGEAGVETDTHRIKFGDGINTWTGLPYSTMTPEDVQDAIEANPSYIEGVVSDYLTANPPSGVPTGGTEGDVLTVVSGTAGWAPGVSQQDIDKVVPPGTPLAGDKITINEDLEPVYSHEPLNPEAFGIYGDGTDETARFNAMVERLAVNGIVRTSQIRFRGRTTYHLTSEIIIKPGVQFVGDGPGWSHGVGTLFRPHPTEPWTGSAMFKAPTIPEDPWTHQFLLYGFQVQDSPAHGIWIENGMGELSYIDQVKVSGSAGHGIYLSGGGIPCRIGNVVTFYSGGAGIMIENASALTTIEQVSGDENDDSLVHIKSGSRIGTVHLGALKCEIGPSTQEHAIVLEDLNGTHVLVDHLQLQNRTTVSPGAAIKQFHTVANGGGTIEVRAFNGVDSLYPKGYEDQTANIVVSGRDLKRFGLDTRRGIKPAAPDQVIEGSVGTTQTVFRHDFDTVPVVTAIIPKSNAQVWESAPADAENVYLTASAVTDAKVTVSSGSAVSAMETVVYSDTFTGTNGANITTSGVPWTTTNAQFIIDEGAARPQGSYSMAYVDAPSPDFVAEVDVSYNPHAGEPRAGGLIFRRDNDGSFFMLGTWTNGNTAAFLLSHSAGPYASSDTVYQPFISFDVTTPKRLTVIARGRHILGKVDGETWFDVQVDRNLTGTGVGMFVSSPGATAPYLTFDNFDLRS